MQDLAVLIASAEDSAERHYRQFVCAPIEGDGSKRSVSFLTTE
jgi:hypothetical protein